MMKRFFAPFVVAFSCSVFVLAGCDTAKDIHSHIHDEAPKLSLKESLVKINKLAGKISEGFADGVDNNVVHGTMHEIGDLLASSVKMIDSSSLSEENKESLKSAVESLMDNFGKVDSKMMHGKEGADYSEVKEKVEEALATTSKISDLIE